MQQKLTEHCKTTILQLKKKKEMRKKGVSDIYRIHGNFTGLWTIRIEGATEV